MGFGRLIAFNAICAIVCNVLIQFYHLGYVTRTSRYGNINAGVVGQPGNGHERKNGALGVWLPCQVRTKEVVS